MSSSSSTSTSTSSSTVNTQPRNIKSSMNWYAYQDASKSLKYRPGRSPVTAVALRIFALLSDPTSSRGAKAAPCRQHEDSSNNWSDTVFLLCRLTSF